MVTAVMSFSPVQTSGGVAYFKVGYKYPATLASGGQPEKFLVYPFLLGVQNPQFEPPI